MAMQQTNDLQFLTNKGIIFGDISTGPKIIGNDSSIILPSSMLCFENSNIGPNIHQVGVGEDSILNLGFYNNSIMINNENTTISDIVVDTVNDVPIADILPSPFPSNVSVVNYKNPSSNSNGGFLVKNGTSDDTTNNMGAQVAYQETRDASKPLDASSGNYLLSYSTNYSQNIIKRGTMVTVQGFEGTYLVDNYTSQYPSDVSNILVNLQTPLIPTLFPGSVTNVTVNTEDLNTIVVTGTDLSFQDISRSSIIKIVLSDNTETYFSASGSSGTSTQYNISVNTTTSFSHSNVSSIYLVAPGVQKQVRFYNGAFSGLVSNGSESRIGNFTGINGTMDELVFLNDLNINELKAESTASLGRTTDNKTEFFNFISSDYEDLTLGNNIVKIDSSNRDFIQPIEYALRMKVGDKYLYLGLFDMVNP